VAECWSGGWWLSLKLNLQLILHKVKFNSPSYFFQSCGHWSLAWLWQRGTFTIGSAVQSSLSMRMRTPYTSIDLDASRSWRWYQGVRLKVEAQCVPHNPQCVRRTDANGPHSTRREDAN
jgi:hypothetical protein